MSAHCPGSPPDRGPVPGSTAGVVWSSGLGRWPGVRRGGPSDPAHMIMPIACDRLGRVSVDCGSGTRRSRAGRGCRATSRHPRCADGPCRRRSRAGRSWLVQGLPPARCRPAFEGPSRRPDLRRQRGFHPPRWCRPGVAVAAGLGQRAEPETECLGGDSGVVHRHQRYPPRFHRSWTLWAVRRGWQGRGSSPPDTRGV